MGINSTRASHITGKTQYNEILGTRKFCLLYQISCLSVVYKQYKTKEIISLGLEKTVCYIRYFVIFFRSLYKRVSTVEIYNSEIFSVEPCPNILSVIYYGHDMNV